MTTPEKDMIEKLTEMMKSHSEAHDLAMAGVADRLSSIEAKINPVIELYSGGKIVGTFLTVIGKLFLWIMGFGITYFTLKGFIK